MLKPNEKNISKNIIKDPKFHLKQKHIDSLLKIRKNSENPMRCLKIILKTKLGEKHMRMI